MQKLLTFLFLFGLLSACAPKDNSAPAQGKTYFDLEGYIDAEVERLANQQTAARKTITLNGVTETREREDFNYANDLRLFRQADINKPAWVDKYAVVEDKGSVGHLTTTYTALDSSLIVRQLIVEEDQGVPVRIEVDRKTGSVLSDGRQRLVYAPAKGYEVHTTQENRFGDDVVAEITVNWQ